ncbi:MAG: ATP-binding cassette domain-containing protein [Sphaerochaetaceae bacterium]|nr:ATP-binding cassette domain-containing protein [Sphaerochaetaceae bacterium]
MKAFELKGVSFSYPGGEKILDSLELSIEEGQFVCITGANGSGKSTLALLLNSLLKPTEGSVNIFGLEDDFEIKKNVQLVFQDPESSFVSDTVERDVAFGPENLCLEPSEIRKRVDGALSLLGIEEFSEKRVNILSGGQKQLVSLAGALALKPRALVLDESLSMLDAASRSRVCGVLKKLCRKDGVTVVMITHRLEEESLSDCVYEMREGRCIRT